MVRSQWGRTGSSVRGISTWRRMKLDSYLTPDTKSNLTWIKDFNVRLETVRLLQENIRGKLPNTGLSNYILSMTPKSSGNRSKKSQMGSYQGKSLCTAQ